MLLRGTFTARTGESMSVKVTGTVVSIIPLFDLLGDTSATFGIHLRRPHCNGTLTLTASFHAAELNLVPGALIVRNLSAIIDLANGFIDFTASGKAEFMISAKLLVLQVAGTASTSRDVSLDVSTTKSYVTLPEFLPYFTMPCLTGKLTAGADNGSKPMSVTAEAVSFSMTNVLQFDDWTGMISVDNSDTAVDIKVAGTMVIGGTNGFSATIAAEIDAVHEKINIEVTHEGD